LFGLAVNSFHGVLACSYGRTYSRDLKSGTKDPTRSIKKVLWNFGELSQTALEKCAVSFATSSFEPHPILELIFMDNRIVEDQEQQSFNVEDGPLFGKGFEDEEDLTLYWQNMGYTHSKIIEATKLMGEKYGIMVHSEVYNEHEYVRDCQINGVEPEACRAITYLSRVNKLTYKTADYMLSCAQSYRPGENGFQQHIWQATLGENAIVFTNHPGTLTEGEGRPDLWAGNGIFPRAAQYKHTLVSIHRLREDVSVRYSHAYFPKRGFEEVSEIAGWVFGRKNDGYIALYSQNGYVWSVNPKHAEEEIICESLANIWVCRVGSKQEHGSFAAFAAAILQSGLQFNGLDMSWDVAGDTIQFGWDKPLCVNGEEIALTGYQRFENPYCKSEYRSGNYEIRFEEDSLILNFD
jgi:hypothetical protein